MAEIVPDRVFDAQGLMCPMPLVKTRQEILSLDVGQVLKVIATDKGSVLDFQGWSRVAKNIELLDQQQDQSNGSEVFIHFVKRVK